MLYCGSSVYRSPDEVIGMVYACLNTCCSHFLTTIAGVVLHCKQESELPVEAANHYTNDAGLHGDIFV